MDYGIFRNKSDEFLNSDTENFPHAIKTKLNPSGTADLDTVDAFLCFDLEKNNVTEAEDYLDDLECIPYRNEPETLV